MFRTFLIFSIIYSMGINAHVERHVSLMDADESTGEPRLGYGYVGRTSEFDARMDRTSFICLDEGMDQEKFCRDSGNKNFLNILAPTHKGFFQELSERELTQEFEKKLAEYQFLQTSAAGGRDLNSVNHLKCINGVREVSNPPTLPNKDEDVIKLIAAEEEKGNIEKANTIRKIRSLKGAMDPMRMAEAVLHYEQLKIARASLNEYSDASVWVRNKRADLDEKKKTLENSFPAIFDTGKLKYQEIKKDIITLLGSIGADSSIYADISGTSLDEKLFERGLRLFNEDFTTDNGQIYWALGGGEDAIDSRILDALELERENTTNEIPAGPSLFGFLKHSYEIMKGSLPVGEMKQKELSNRILRKFNDLNNKNEFLVARDVRNLCKNQPNNLKDLAEDYPNVFRQFLLDLEDDQFAGAQSTLCKHGMDKLLNQKADSQCNGVEGKLTDPNGVKVQRTSYDWPYGSANNYQIRQKPDGSYELETKINFKFHYDESIADEMNREEQLAEYNKLVADWKKKANDKFNDRAEELKKSLGAEVKFKVQVGDGDEKPVVTVSKCYHADLPKEEKRSCKAVREKKNGRMRADSGNYSFETSEGTLAHEVAHLFSVDDEYYSRYKRFSPMGERDSIMRSSRTGDFYARHFRKMIEPAFRCGY